MNSLQSYRITVFIGKNRPYRLLKPNSITNCIYSYADPDALLVFVRHSGFQMQLNFSEASPPAQYTAINYTFPNNKLVNVIHIQSLHDSLPQKRQRPHQSTSAWNFLHNPLLPHIKNLIAPALIPATIPNLHSISTTTSLRPSHTNC